MGIGPNGHWTKWVLDQMGIGPNGHWTKWALDQMGLDQLGLDEMGIGRNGFRRNSNLPEFRNGSRARSKIFLYLLPQAKNLPSSLSMMTTAVSRNPICPASELCNITVSCSGTSYTSSLLIGISISTCS